jgi:hypothetical protein
MYYLYFKNDQNPKKYHDIEEVIGCAKDREAHLQKVYVYGEVISPIMTRLFDFFPVDPYDIEFRNIVLLEDISRFSLDIKNFRGDVCFKRCQIYDLRIEHFNNGLRFDNCKNNKVTIFKGHPKSIEVLGIRSSIDTLLLEDAGVSILKIGKGTVTNKLIIKSIDNKKIDEVNILGKISTELLINSFIVSKMIFSSTKINSANVYQAEIQSLKVSECVDSSFNFYSSTFTMDECHITGRDMSIYFSKSTFRTKDSLLVCANHRRNSKITFSNCRFLNDTEFNLQPDYVGSIVRYQDCEFLNTVRFNDGVINCIVLIRNIFQKGLLLPCNDDLLNTSGVHSSVWCTLKDQAISKNDYKLANIYKRNELNSYIEEIKNQKLLFEERIALIFNQISNNHGFSWVRGLLFTIVSWFGFYLLYYLFSNSYSVFWVPEKYLFIMKAEFWSDAIEFLWLPHGLGNLADQLKKSTSFLQNLGMVISFLLGKIFIAYGIYQTISAFRKFGKG